MNIFESNFFTPKSETFFLTEDTTIRQALEKFDFHKFSVVPLIRADGTYLTTVSEGDMNTPVGMVHIDRANGAR